MRGSQTSGTAQGRARGAAWWGLLGLVVAGVGGCGAAGVAEDSSLPQWPKDVTGGDAANRPPEAPEVAIGPPLATTEDDLYVDVLVDASDPDGDPLLPRYRWLVDGVETDLEGPEVPAGATARDQVWELRVAVSDGRLRSAEASALLVIQNAVPVPRVTLRPDSPDTSDALAVEAVVDDPDGDAVGLVYRWWRDGAETPHTERSIDAALTRAGEHWTVGVRALDGRGEGPEVVEGITIANAAPRVRAVEVGPEGATVGDRLSAVVEADDLDGDALVLTLDWELDGTVVQSGPDTVLLGPTPPRGTTVEVVATATDGAAVSNRMRSAPLVIANSPPAFTGAALSPAAPAVDGVVACLPTGWTDPDGDPEQADIDWELDGVPVVGSATLDLAGLGLVGGETIVCRAIPDDGYTHGAPVEAAGEVVP